MDIITAIRELTTFDHAACDARIVSHGSWLWLSPLMCAFGVVCVIAQANGLIEYAGVCRSLLRLS